MNWPKTILIACLLCAASFGGGLWFGLQRDVERTDAHENEAVARMGRRKASTDGSTIRPTPEIMDQEPSRRKPLPEYLSDLLALEEEIDRSFHFVQLLDSLEPSEFPGLYGEIRALPAGPKQIRMLEKFYRRWGELDPVAASEHAHALVEGHRLRYISEVAVGWAKQDPVSAWNWIMEVSNNGGIRGFRSDLVMSEIVRRDVATAFALADSLTDGMIKDFIGRRIARDIAQSGAYHAGLSEILSRGASPSNYMLLNQMFRFWGRNEFTEAQSAVQGISDDRMRDQAQIGFVSGWAMTDPGPAMQYVLDKMEGENRGRLLQAVAGVWARNGNIDEVASLLDSLPVSKETDSGVVEIISSITGVDPGAAMSWVDTIENEERRAHIRSWSVREWAGADPIAAEKYVYQLEAGNEKDRALQGLAWGHFRMSDIGDGAFSAIDKMASSAIQQETLLRLADITSRSWGGNITVDKGKIRDQIAAMRNVPDGVKQKALALLE